MIAHDTECLDKVLPECCQDPGKHSHASWQADYDLRLWALHEFNIWKETNTPEVFEIPPYSPKFDKNLYIAWEMFALTFLS